MNNEVESYGLTSWEAGKLGAALTLKFFPGAPYLLFYVFFIWSRIFYHRYIYLQELNFAHVYLSFLLKIGSFSSIDIYNYSYIFYCMIIGYYNLHLFISTYDIHK